MATRFIPRVLRARLAIAFPLILFIGLATLTKAHDGGSRAPFAQHLEFRPVRASGLHLGMQAV
jgi:hypothetical protein